MRTNLLVTAEFSSPEIGTLSIKKGTNLIRAYANAEAYTLYKQLVGQTEFDASEDKQDSPTEG